MLSISLLFFSSTHNIGVPDALFTPYLLLTLLLSHCWCGQIKHLASGLSFSSKFLPSFWTAPSEFPDSTSSSSCSEVPISSSSQFPVTITGTTIHSLTYAQTLEGNFGFSTDCWTLMILPSQSPSHPSPLLL